MSTTREERVLEYVIAYGVIFLSMGALFLFGGHLDLSGDWPRMAQMLKNVGRGLLMSSSLLIGVAGICYGTIKSIRWIDRNG